jgi:predicted amino acid-binding ACT domain protein
MALHIYRIQVWSGDVPDRPGAAAGKLEVLAQAGADLKFIFSRPKPGHSELHNLFVAPVTGPDQVHAARQAGLSPDHGVAMLCVEGTDRPGIAFRIMSCLAVAGINLQGLSISSVNERFAAYLAFDHPDTVNQAIQILATLEL